MNTEEDEFNRIEREASMRKEAVRATVEQQEPLGYVTATEMQMFLASGRPAIMWKRTANTEGIDVPVYADTPAQRPWVGLTLKDIKEIERKYVFFEDAIRLIEAKLREKNQ